MSKIEWSQVKMSDIQQNILTGGKEGVSAADALDARSAAYQAGKSHGAARFLKGLFSLGINEIWRFANYQSYGILRGQAPRKADFQGVCCGCAIGGADLPRFIDACCT